MTEAPKKPYIGQCVEFTHTIREVSKNIGYQGTQVAHRARGRVKGFVTALGLDDFIVREKPDGTGWSVRVPYTGDWK